MKNAKFNNLLEICTMLLLNYPILGWKSRVKPFFMKYFEAFLPTRHSGRNTAKLKRNFPRFPAQMPVIDENEMCNGSLKVLFQKSLQWWEPEVRTPKLRRLLCNRRSRSHARPRIGFALTIAPSSTSYRPTISSACVQLWSVRPLFASSTFPRQKLTLLISISCPPSFNPTLFRVLASNGCRVLGSLTIGLRLLFGCQSVSIFSQWILYPERGAGTIYVKVVDLRSMEKSQWKRQSLKKTSPRFLFVGYVRSSSLRELWEN